MEEPEYIRKQIAYEERTSRRLREKLRRLGESNDYNRKIMQKMDTGEPKITIEEAGVILYGVWLDLKKTVTTRSDLSCSALVICCLLEFDLADVSHASKARMCQPYALKRCVSDEQARLDFLRGIETVSRAARRLLYKSRETALEDFDEGLEALKRCIEIDSQFAINDDIGFVDQYISQLPTLIPNMKDEVMYEKMHNEATQHIRTQLEQKKLSRGSLWYRSQLNKVPEPYQKIVFLFETGADIRSIREHLLKAWDYRIIEGENQETLANRLFLKAIEDIRTAFELLHPEPARSLNKRSDTEKVELRNHDLVETPQKLTGFVHMLRNPLSYHLPNPRLDVSASNPDYFQIGDRVTLTESFMNDDQEYKKNMRGVVIGKDSILYRVLLLDNGHVICVWKESLIRDK